MKLSYHDVCNAAFVVIRDTILSTVVTSSSPPLTALFSLQLDTSFTRFQIFTNVEQMCSTEANQDITQTGISAT